MIVSKEIKQYENATQFLSYTIDKDGNPVAVADSPVFAGKEGLGNDLYYTKAIELERLKSDVLNGKISPIKLLVDLQNMNEDDIAHRLKLSVKKIRKHFSLKGFKELKINELINYARIFDIAVAEFFQFINIDNISGFTAENFHDRLIQNITIK